MHIDRLKTNQTWMGMALILGAVYYRPLEFWAKNAWDIVKPQDIFVTGSIAFATGSLLFLVAIVIGIRELPAGLFIAGCLFVLFNFHNLPPMSGILWIAMVALITLFAHTVIADSAFPYLAAIVLVVTVVGPTARIVIEHVSQRQPYPLNEFNSRIGAEPTGAVEDVLVLIVDSYPMTAVASKWFGHDTGPLEETLRRAGFAVPRVSWTHNTFTSLAVPSLLQLQQVARNSPKPHWGNRSANYEIVGGENLVASTLREAGFEYTHIESGWNGGTCQVVNTCLESRWLDEANWNMLASSMLRGLLERNYGSMAALNTFAVVDHLHELEVIGDGKHDYIYAHMLLPHSPYVVNGDCEVMTAQETPPTSDSYESLRRQLTCIDSLLIDLVAHIDGTTAVLIAGDHGTGERGQVGRRSAMWTDADIAERLGALLAYRLPDGCAEPTTRTNLHAMRAIMECAVIAELPKENADFLVGEQEPERIEQVRLSSLGERVSDGSLTLSD